MELFILFVKFHQLQVEYWNTIPNIPLQDTVFCKPRDRLRQKPRETRRFFIYQCARWIPPDLEADAQHHENGVGGLPSQQGSWAWAESQLQQNPALLLCAQIPRSYVGQVAHVPPTPWVTPQEANITRRTPEAACWLRLGRWSNNVANSHPGPFDCRVLRSCLVPQCSHPPHRPHHQRRLANCDWMPVPVM